MTGISESAFQNCKSFQRVTIPNSVTSIGNIAFDYGKHTYTYKGNTYNNFEAMYEAVNGR